MLDSYTIKVLEKLPQLFFKNYIRIYNNTGYFKTNVKIWDAPQVHTPRGSYSYVIAPCSGSDLPSRKINVSTLKELEDAIFEVVKEREYAKNPYKISIGFCELQLTKELDRKLSDFRLVMTSLINKK